MGYWILCLDVSQIQSELLQAPPSEDTPDHDEVRVAPALLTPAQRKLIKKWQLRHDLARQALLASLEPAELTKVHHLQSAHEIWKRLADEYGGVSDLKRAQANATFYSFKKPKDAPMQSHVNLFNKLQQEVNYHRESPLSDVDVNLAFLWRRENYISALLLAARKGKECVSIECISIVLVIETISRGF